MPTAHDLPPVVEPLVEPPYFAPPAAPSERFSCTWHLPPRQPIRRARRCMDLPKAPRHGKVDLRAVKGAVAKEPVAGEQGALGKAK